MTAPRCVAGPTRAAGSRPLARVVARFIRDDLRCGRLFTVPGEAFLPLLAEASQAGVGLVTARHEAGAALAAIADARLHGRPAVVAVNRSPGATNASIALDAARADPTPLLLIVGGPRRGTDPLTGFQATDLAGFLGGLAQTIAVPDPAALPGALRRVAAVLSGPVPAPVVLLVPEDTWTDEVVTAGVAGPGATRPEGSSWPRQRAAPVWAVADRLVDAVSAAARPVLLAGRLLRVAGGPGPGVDDLLGRLAGRYGGPVLTANKQQDLLDNRHPHYGGQLHLGTPAATRARLAGADLVVILGDLPDEVHLAGWFADQDLLTVHPQPIGPGQALTADPLAVLRVLADRPWPAPDPARLAWTRGWRALEDELSRPEIRRYPDGLDFAVLAAALDAQLPDGAVVTLDAGHFSSWIHRYLRLRRGQRLLALAGGAMGFGVPAAVAAALDRPAGSVVAVVGDGGLLMTGNELATARASGHAPVVIVADNGSYGTIQDHQARRYALTDCGTRLANPDFVRWAESFGLPATRVQRADEVEPAVRAALSSPAGYLIQVRTGLRAIHANHDLPSFSQEVTG